MRALYLAVVTGVVLAICGCQPPTSREKEIKEEKAAPSLSGKLEITLRKIDGSGDVSITDYRGRYLLLYFTAPWTDSADAASRQIALLAESGIAVVLPIIIDSRGSEAIYSDLDETLAGLNACLSDEKLEEQIGGIRALPTAVLLAPDGTVSDIWPGYVPAATIIQDVPGSADALISE